jgi:Flp pilus assembly protein TadG
MSRAKPAKRELAMRVQPKTRRRRGTAVAEMAVVMPLFIFLIFGQIESARLGMVSQLLTTAAREGCRVAVVDGNTNTDVNNRLTSILTSMGISGWALTQTPTDCTTVHAADTTNTITVSLSVPYSAVSWLPSPFFLKNVTVTSAATMSSERP